MKRKIFKLQGQVQHYAWGGHEFIPRLLGIDNTAKQPFAEYWMGAHPSASGVVADEQGAKPWVELIRQNPEEHLGEEVVKKFGELPYLFKVLDVSDMLSIQVHPTKEAAARGYDAEEAAGVPINAPNRNYKDRNHKPEVMVALGEFWLLHGFKKEAALQQTLLAVPEFAELLPVFNNGNYYELYKQVMEMPQAKADALLMPLVKREIAGEHKKYEAGYWVTKLYKDNLPHENFDRGIFSIYFFNIVQVNDGQAVFQGAGLPHAYLEGQNVELMANSDNVLRGGLTPKHIDVPELLKHIEFKGIEPNILDGEISVNGERKYQLPVADFGISGIKLENGREYISESQSAEVFLVLSGQVHIDHLTCKKGEVFVVLPGEKYTLRCIEDAQLYKAFVPL